MEQDHREAVELEQAEEGEEEAVVEAVWVVLPRAWWQLHLPQLWAAGGTHRRPAVLSEEMPEVRCRPNSRVTITD